MNVTIRLDGLVIPVRIGWTDAERATPQPIRFDLTVSPPRPPAAVVTDQLEDTVDYARLAETIRAVATGAEWRLLERLAGAVVGALRPLVGEARLTLRVGKTAPIEGLQGDASVTLIDPA